MKIKIVIADDHPLMCEGIKKIFQAQKNIEIIAMVNDGEQAIKMVKEHNPDLLLLDIDMPKVNGVEVARKLHLDYPSKCKVVIYTEREEKEYYKLLLKFGIYAYISKNIPIEDFKEAVIKVIAMDSCLPSIKNEENSNVLLKDKKGNLKRHSLTNRELEIIQLIGKGMKNNEIATELFLSEKTVKNHLTNIFKKLNVNDRTQVLIHAIKNKLVLLS